MNPHPDLWQGIGMLRLTRKASLIAARTALPASLEDVKEGAILPGFIASATPVCQAALDFCEAMIISSIACVLTLVARWAASASFAGALVEPAHWSGILGLVAPVPYQPMT